MSALPQRVSSLLHQALPFQALSRDLKVLFISNLFASFGDGLTIYLLPLFIRSLGARPQEVGFLYSVLTIAGATTIIPGGILADRYDRKRILIMGWALWVPVPLFFALATSWTQLPLGMFLYGVLFSGPASSAYIVGQAAKGKMTSTFTLLVSAWGIGYMLAPTLAGFLAEAVGMRWVFFLTTVFYFITTILLTQISSQHPKKDEVSAEEAQKTWDGSPFRRGRIFLLSTLFASVMFLLSLVFPLVPQFLSDVYRLDIVQIGILGSFTYLGGSTLSLIMGRIGDRHGKTTAVSIAMILVAIALTIFICVDSFAFLIFASFLRGASFPMWAFIGATVGPIAPVASRARWISVVQTATQMVSILAPYVGGILYVHSPQAPFLLTIGVSVMLAIIAQTPLFKERVASDTLRSGSH